MMRVTKVVPASAMPAAKLGTDTVIAPLRPYPTLNRHSTQFVAQSWLNLATSKPKSTTSALMMSSPGPMPLLHSSLTRETRMGHQHCRGHAGGLENVENGRNNRD